jgi:hypothetical protein
VSDHLLQLQFIQALSSQGGTDETTGINGHKVDVLRCHLLRSDDQVTFIFPILIIYYNNHLSRSYLGNGFFNCVKLLLLRH